MREYRPSKGEKEHYTSFVDCAIAWGCNAVSKQTKNEKKLEGQKDKFLNKHLCKQCKKPMEYIGGNMLVCSNESCKGIKHDYKDEETNETKVWYTTSYELLDDLGAEIANNIFS